MPTAAKFYSQCRQCDGCWNCVTESVVGTKGKMDLGGNGGDGYHQEHVDLINAIRTAPSSTTAGTPPPAA